MMTSYLLLMTLLTNEIQTLQYQVKMCGLQERLFLKINLISSHSMTVSWSAYKLFSWASYILWGHSSYTKIKKEKKKEETLEEMIKGRRRKERKTKWRKLYSSLNKKKKIIHRKVHSEEKKRKIHDFRGKQKKYILKKMEGRRIMQVYEHWNGKKEGNKIMMRRENGKSVEKMARNYVTCY